jgi:hypothetical protein
MIFAFIEDGTVDVLENEAAARIHSEPIDVENRVVIFYSDSGTYLEPRFTKPNRRRLFGFVLEQGEFELVPNPAGDPVIDPFDIALTEAAILNPNPWFKTLDEIGRYVQTKRAEK